MKQKLGLACAIIGKPKIIILDEPINALDNEGVIRINELLDSLKNGRIIILAYHDRHELGLLADTILDLKQGILVNERVTIHLNRR